MTQFISFTPEQLKLAKLAWVTLSDYFLRPLTDAQIVLYAERSQGIEYEYFAMAIVEIMDDATWLKLPLPSQVKLLARQIKVKKETMFQLEKLKAEAREAIARGDLTESDAIEDRRKKVSSDFIETVENGI